jgi:hypothetical protein
VYKLSLRIDGEITIEAFRQAVDHFVQLLHEIDEAVSGEGRRSVRWTLADLRRSSPAVLTWIGEPRRRRLTKRRPRKPIPDLAPEVGETLIAGVEKLERGEGRPLAFSDDALDATKGLAHLKMRRGITGVVISGGNGDRTKEPRALDVTERTAAAVNEIIGPKYTGPGSVEGILQAINSHGDLYIVVYDSTWGGRVQCEVPARLKRDALDLFDERVLVMGQITTDASGHPRKVKAEKISPMPKRDDLPQSLRGLDRDYTEGLPSSQYLKKQWAGEDA